MYGVNGCSTISGVPIADLRAVINGVAGEIATDPDAVARYQRATEAGALGQVLLHAAAQLRGMALVALRDEHGWSLGEIGAAVGLSKSRVDQLISQVEAE